MYEKMGIEIISEYNDLLYQVKLPKDWKLEVDNDWIIPAWSNVKDSKGRSRINFLYKIELEKIESFSRFNTRYSYDIMPFDEYMDAVSYNERQNKPWHGVIKDCKKVIWRSKELPFKNDSKLRDIAEKEIDKRYPNWRDIFAYWDED